MKLPTGREIRSHADVERIILPGHHYRNDPKFSDRYAWTNRADPDQTAV